MSHQYSQQSSSSSSHSHQESSGRHLRRARNPPPVSNISNEHYQHNTKSQEPVQDLMAQNRYLVDSSRNAEPVIVLNDIGDKINPSINRLGLPPHLDNEADKIMNSPNSKEKAVDPNKNKPVVLLEMLDPSVSAVFDLIFHLISLHCIISF